MARPSLSARTVGAGQFFSRRDVLRWLYMGRLTLVTGILAAALRRWLEARPEDTLISTVVFLVAVGVTALSYLHTHVRGTEPRVEFLYGQVIFDIFVVTAVVHVTGGPESNFAPLYILVISLGALLLPLPGGVLLGALASLVYWADLAWGFEGDFHLGVALQLGLFTAIALLTGLVGDRLRRAGMALGEVESELRQLRLDTGDILANLSTGVLTVDGTGLLAYANPAAEALLGLDAREWLGRPIMEEVERLAPGMGEALRTALRERRRVERYQTASNRNGEELTLGLSVAVLERDDGMAPSATAMFQDITDLELVDALNRRAERLEAVAALSASLAHEIKNPLASIRSAVEQLTRATALQAKDRDVLRRLVLTESDRLSRLLSEFLEYSGLRMGAKEPIDLRALVRDCVTLVRQHPDAEAVELVCEGDGPALIVSGDPDLLHRAVFNLALNAVQFAGQGGRVVVIPEEIGLRRNPLGVGAVGITVRDSGPGVDPRDVERIFDPFYTTRGGGSGLGLAVVHRAVEAHAGAIFVERAPEGGAQFSIYFPGRVGEPQEAST
ncbi:MAG TPA: ATP-binding protein [Longimicrobiales bacterium]|nr:ATP-binding protein [Longimicrobiales bacterium]